jgi:hypothetical protein
MQVKPKDRQSRILEIVGRDGEASVSRRWPAHSTSRSRRSGATCRNLPQPGRCTRCMAGRGGSAACRRQLRGAALRGCRGQGRDRADAGKGGRAGRHAVHRYRDDHARLRRGTGRVDGLTVITNSAVVAQRPVAQRPRHRVYLVGGEYSRGQCPRRWGHRHRPDRALSGRSRRAGVAALDAEAGAMDADFDEAQIARAMIECANMSSCWRMAASSGERPRSECVD